MILTDYAIRFRTAVIFFAIVAVITGVFSYAILPREGAPDITIPYVFISAPYEGVAPAEIENLVTIPLEKRLNDLENVDEIISTSTEGASIVVVKFTPKEDLNNALQRVKDKIDMARPDLPTDLDEPVVEVFNMSSDLPILVPVLSGNVDADQLKIVAEDMKERVERVPGVKQVDIYGTREREIRIEIIPERLAQYRISMGAIMRSLSAENRTVSAGNLEIAGGKFQVRVPGEFKLVSEIRNVVIVVRDGNPVYLTDVATVSDSFKDLTSISRLNGQPSVSLQIKKRSGENTVGIIREIKEVIKDIPLPAGMALTMTGDQSEWIVSMVEELENNIITGFLLVVVVLMIFMGIGNSVFVALAIPLSMLIAFTLMAVQGVTLNFIVLFSLVMATGMLVDNGIVIVENIYRLRMTGLSRMDAARRGASEVAWPITTSTLTTVVAFLPLLYWPDVMGQFMGFLPKTLIVTLMASLFVGLMVNPAICSLHISASKGRHSAFAQAFFARYESFLHAALRHRAGVIALGFAFFAFTMAMYSIFGRRGVELFPDTAPRSATITVKYPQGTAIEKADATMKTIESKLSGYRDVRFFVTTVGAAGGFSFGPGGGGTHVGNIYVEFVKQAERSEDSMSIVHRIRDDVGRFAGAEVLVDREREGPPTGAPISIEIAGEDFETLSHLSSEMIRAIRNIPGVVDLKDDLEEAMPELQVHVDRRRAAMLGVDTAAVGTFLRSAIFGSPFSKFRAGEDEFDITVRLPEGARTNVDLLNQIQLPLESGLTVPLSSVGQVVYAGGRGDVIRKNRKRVVTITGDIEQRSIDAILNDIRSSAAAIPMPPGYSVTYTGENKEMKQSGAFLLKAFGVAVALIAVILVIEFNSAILPIIILISVILSMIGVMWGLGLCRMRFGVIMTGVGVISLAGVVVNNSIVLIDCILQKRREGMSAEEAAVSAGRQRLRPVLLTAGTTILGLIPMAVGWSLEFHTFPWKFVAGAESSDWWAPMAVAVIFGLGFATILTLVQVPVLYCAIESMKARLFRGIAARDDAAVGQSAAGAPDRKTP